MKAFGILAPGSDTTPPTVPQNPTATALSSTSIAVSWQPSTDNVGVSGYQVYRDNVPVWTTSNVTWTDTGRSPGTSYSYRISAFDAAGNASALSTTASATTAANSAPVWTDPGDQALDLNSGYFLDLGALVSDADGDSITMSLASGSLPTGLSFNAGLKTISGVPTVNLETTGATFAASDGIAAAVNLTIAFRVSHLPVWLVAENYDLGEQTVGLSPVTVPLSAYAYDEDDDTILYTRTGGNAPAGVTVNETTGVVTLPADIPAGTYTVEVTLSDQSPLVVPGAFYVSTTGNDSTGDGSISNPWATPAYGASQLTVDGGTLYLRAGTYDVPTSTATRSCAIFPRANNCTIAGYPGDPPRSAILRGGVNGANFGVAPTGGVIGAYAAKSGTVISNLTVIGMVMFDGCTAGTRANRLENCDVSVGGDPWDGITQGITVWLDSAYYVEIVNNYIHDSPSATGGANGMLTAYDFQNLLIEQNTFKRPKQRSIILKDVVDNVTIRRNFFYDSADSGIWLGNNSVAQPAGTVGWIYQNIFAKVPNVPYGQADDGGAICSMVTLSKFEVYNNVFDDVDNNYGDLSMRVGGVPLNWFNNIHSRSIYFMRCPYNTSNFAPDYVDYNCYSGGGKWGMNAALGGGGLDTTDLATWRTYANTYLLPGDSPDSHSITTDPGFLNAGGSYALPTDFKRSAYTTNGRGGSWPNVMGAYITGSEQIGADWT